ncbi:hypothetical protein [Kitasatospora sp. HPMI-4]|uniref:hypothetical protein n=1 Tax=Kitasatospora sp. HPMI-4 TaxID=3448443 RepID=UPI003F1AA507
MSRTRIAVVLAGFAATVAVLTGATTDTVKQATVADTSWGDVATPAGSVAASAGHAVALVDDNSW